jgi:4-hydroxybenzoate polyprenyltransferase/phosphoserine phosphatase
MKNKPIIIDLDGTIVHTDMLHENIFSLLAAKPLEILKIPYYLFKGKAYLKKKLALESQLDVTNLPYNYELLDWIKDQKNKGSNVVLCTGSDIIDAKKISDFLGIFDDVIASDGKLNLVGKNKANILVEQYGSKNFHYAGNSRKDIHIWKESDHAIVINSSKKLLNTVKKICKVTFTIPKRKIHPKIIIKAMRVHQWLKNLLLFAPFIAAHQINNFESWVSVTIGFVSFSLCASAIYLLNDLTDLSNDRSHPRKKERPFASGKLPFYYGVLLIPLLLVSSFAIAIIFSNSEFTIWLFLYLLLTTLYTFIIKPIVFLDVIVLAMLFTIRIIAGSATLLLPLSPWILAFSIFLFVSLAIIKRYAELEIQIIKNISQIKGRGYYTSDASLIQSIGLASGFCSILVFVLYLNSPEVMALYNSPEIIWLCIPILIYWQSWMWLSAHRGEMHDDPIIFAIKDKHSLMSGFLFVFVLFLGTVKF